MSFRTPFASQKKSSSSSSSPPPHEVTSLRSWFKRSSSDSNLSRRAHTRLKDVGAEDEQNIPAIGMVKSLEIEKDDDSHSTHCNSETTTPSSNSSFISLELKSSLKVKTNGDSVNQTYGQRSSSTQHVPSIRFSQVTSHYHEYQLGDHPEVSSGAPLSLGCWESSDEMSVEDHEKEREERCRESPWKDRNIVSAKARERMLLEAGVPYQNIRRRISRMKMQKDMLLRSRILSNHSERKRDDV